MNDYITESFIHGLRKEIGKTKRKRNGLKIKPTNFETVSLSANREIIFELTDIVELHDWLANLIRVRAHQVRFLASYHPNSPSYWLKDIEKLFNYDEEQPSFYKVSIDLEDFIERKLDTREKKLLKEVDYYIPDNYKISKTILKDFKKAYPQYAKIKFEDATCREESEWRYHELDPIKALGEYINKQHVQPEVKKIMKSGKIKEVKFYDENGERKIDFIYK